MSTEINETNAAQTSQKGGKAGKIIAGILFGGCLAASLGLNIYQAVVPNQKTADFIDYMYDRIAEEEKSENEYIEDGFKVGGEYEIRSTTHISDAYKSGDDSQLSEEDKETLKLASDVLDEVIEDGMSDYEKEEAIYLWMVENIGHGFRGSSISRPGMNRSSFTPHDVLTNYSAVCVGYATTFRLLLNMVDIDVHIVHNEYHSWDLVQLDDGWYHVDIYSDAHGVLYGNFNMTDQMCDMSHSWDQSALPEAKSVKYSPAVRNAISVKDVYAVPAAMKAAMDEKKNQVIFFSFETPLDDDGMALADLLARSLDTAFSMMEGGYYFGASWYLGEQDSYILGLYVESYDSDDEHTLDDDSPEAKQIIQAIADAFELDPEMFGIYSDEPASDWVEVPADVIDGGSIAVPLA